MIVLNKYFLIIHQFKNEVEEVFAEISSTGNYSRVPEKKWRNRNKVHWPAQFNTRVSKIRIHIFRDSIARPSSQGPHQTPIKPVAILRGHFICSQTNCANQQYLKSIFGDWEEVGCTIKFLRIFLIQARRLGFNLNCLLDMGEEVEYWEAQSRWFADCLGQKRWSWHEVLGDHLEWEGWGTTWIDLEIAWRMVVLLWICINQWFFCS